MSVSTSISIGFNGNGMRYLYRSEKGVNRRVMHIMKFTEWGGMTNDAMCEIDYPFNVSINAPWGLGRPVCKDCLRKCN